MMLENSGITQMVASWSFKMNWSLNRGQPNLELDGTARSMEDETGNGDWNANRNSKQNQETTVLGLFSKN